MLEVQGEKGVLRLDIGTDELIKAIKKTGGK